MTITIEQVCDKCGTIRQLNDTTQADHGGWRKVTGLKHLCSDCIRKAVGND